MKVKNIFSLLKNNVHNVRYCCTCIGINDVYILSAARTPIGKFQGKLAPLSAVQLATKTLIQAVACSGVPKTDIEELVLGTVFPTGLGQCPAHQVALFSGLSESIITSTVNKACGSGMKAIMVGAQMIMSKAHEVVAVGGAESSSNVPFFLRRKNLRRGAVCLPDIIYHDGLICMLDQIDVTQHADESAREYKISREEQDDFAILSYKRAAEAQQNNVFEAEMTPVSYKTQTGEEVIREDENISLLNEEKLRSLSPDFPGGTVTTANASGMSDAAAMLIICNGNYLLKKGLRPMAKILSFCDASLPPRQLSLTPSVCIPKALMLANLRPEEVTRWEISETFAITTILNARLLNIDLKNVNIYGGTISLGHPFGMTGARLIGHLAHTLPADGVGVACISHAAGGASGMVIQKM